MITLSKIILSLYALATINLTTISHSLNWVYSQHVNRLLSFTFHHWEYLSRKRSLTREGQLLLHQVCCIFLQRLFLSFFKTIYIHIVTTLIASITPTSVLPPMWQNRLLPLNTYSVHSYYIFTIYKSSSQISLLMTQNLLLNLTHHSPKNTRSVKPPKARLIIFMLWCKSSWLIQN